MNIKSEAKAYEVNYKLYDSRRNEFTKRWLSVKHKMRNASINKTLFIYFLLESRNAVRRSKMMITALLMRVKIWELLERTNGCGRIWMCLRWSIDVQNIASNAMCYLHLYAFVQCEVCFLSTIIRIEQKTSARINNRLDAWRWKKSHLKSIFSQLEIGYKQTINCLFSVRLLWVYFVRSARPLLHAFNHYFLEGY